MGFFNSGGLITRGYGNDHRIVTRGMSVKFDFGGVRKYRKESKEYNLNIVTPIIKENSGEIRIYSPLEIRREEEIFTSSNVSKKVEEDLDLFARIDHSRLSELLDAI